MQPLAALGVHIEYMVKETAIAVSATRSPPEVVTSCSEGLSFVELPVAYGYAVSSAGDVSAVPVFGLGANAVGVQFKIPCPEVRYFALTLFTNCTQE